MTSLKRLVRNERRTASSGIWIWLKGSIFFHENYHVIWVSNQNNQFHLLKSISHVVFCSLFCNLIFVYKWISFTGYGNCGESLLSPKLAVFNAVEKFLFTVIRVCSLSKGKYRVFIGVRSGMCKLTIIKKNNINTKEK